VLEGKIKKRKMRERRMERRKLRTDNLAMWHKRKHQKQEKRNKKIRIFSGPTLITLIFVISEPLFRVYTRGSFCLLVVYLACSSTLKMDGVGSRETSVNYLTDYCTSNHNIEGSNFENSLKGKGKAVPVLN
jgi:hypothetical protein